jgi:geranylgeranyl diphosphate synthase type I
MTRAGQHSHDGDAPVRVGGVARSPADAEDRFVAFVTLVRSHLEERLATWLDARVEEARVHGDVVAVVADAMRNLVLRGGKRMRAVLVSAAYEACGGGASAIVASAGVSIELLQGYLLAHDDWMDGDQMRRGGPSVPAMMAARFDHATAGAMSILAGDLAAAWARRAIFEVPLPADRLVAAARELASIEADVVQGQVLDVGGHARTSRDIEAMHALKTSSYTVRGPVVLGARLAGASEAQTRALTAFGLPLGVAFQLRDDVLGTFGDERATGKSAGNDLRNGRHTAVIGAVPFEAPIARVFGRAEATKDELDRAVAYLEACGARRRVEERILELTASALEALEHADLTSTGRALLSRCAQALTERSA